ncbi:MAG: hypothetical protein LBK99_01420 [Opitutaceae bacterium]|jgi:hypothetical protein|nr:hypothetical protein [Opitutaceae bacterium]
MIRITSRKWFPKARNAQLQWAANHIIGLEKLGESVFGIQASFITAMRKTLTQINAFIGYHDQAEELGREYTQIIDRILWDADGKPIQTPPPPRNRSRSPARSRSRSPNEPEPEDEDEPEENQNR